MILPAATGTAYFSNRRQPGVVLRVSRIFAFVPRTASTNCAVDSRDAGKPLDEIQRDALGAQNGAAGTGNFQQRFPAGTYAPAIGNAMLNSDFGGTSSTSP